MNLKFWLSKAVEIGYKAVSYVLPLLKREPPPLPLPLLPSPLLKACQDPNLDEIIPLLEQGAKVNDKDEKSGNTPLFIVLAQPYSGTEKEDKITQIVKALINKGADLLAPNKFGLSAQHMQRNRALLKACHDYVLTDIQKALDEGADANTADENGNTPLQIILKPNGGESVVKMVEILLAKGADPLLCNQNKENALNCAAIAELPEVIPLISNKISVNALNGQKQTPLMHAIEYYSKNSITRQQIKFVEKLIEHGAQPNIKSRVQKDGCVTTPFVYALRHSNTKYPPNKDSYGVMGFAHDFDLYHLGRGRPANDSHLLTELCELLLNKGANPCATIETNEGNKTVHRNYFFESASDWPYKQLYERCKKLIESPQFIFTIPEAIAASQDATDIKKIVNEAIHYLSAGDQQAIIKLMNAFIEKDNTEALDCLIQQVKPFMIGYVALQEKMIHRNLNMAEHLFYQTLNIEPSGIKKDLSLLDKYPDEQKQISEFRTLAVKHFLMAGLSQEETEEAKKTVKELNRLYQISLAEWKGASFADEEVDHLNIDNVSKDIVENTKIYAQLFQLKKAQTVGETAPSTLTEKAVITL